MKSHKLPMGGTEIEVSISKDEINKHKAVGVMIQDKLTRYRILMHEAIPSDALVSILIHELVEAANHMYGLELEHPAIQTLEVALFQALPQRGKDAIAQWIEELRETSHEKVQEPELENCAVYIALAGD